jgi:putative membrane protein
MKRLPLASAALCAGLALSLAACNQNPASTNTSSDANAGGNNNAVSAVKDATVATVDKANAEITTSTAGFVQAAAVTDMYEVQAGKIALMRSHSDAVKKFAQAMIDAHTMSTEALKKAIVDSNATVTTPSELDSAHQTLINDLNGAKDEDFDARYISQQIDAHSAALTLFDGYMKDGDNPQIKAFAQMVQPVIQMHLDMAKGLSQSK